MKKIESLRKKIHRLSTLLEVGKIITSTLELKQLLEIILETVRRVMEVEAVSLALIEDGELIFHSVRGGEEEKIKKIKLKIGEGICGWVAKEGRPLLVPEVEKEPRFFAQADELTGFKTKSIGCVPLHTKEKTIGALEVINKLRGEFTPEDLELLEGIASQVSISIENARLYEEVNTLKEFNENILWNITSGVCVIDRKGKVVAFNRAAQEMLGLSSAEVMAQEAGEVFSSLGEKNIGSLLQDGWKGKVYENLELKVENPREKRELILMLDTSFLRDDLGRTYGIIGILRDVTRLREMEEWLRRAERLAALGQMAAGVAHEIRNPLNAIRGFAQLLQMEVGDEETRKKHSSIIIKEVDRLNRVVEEVLEYTREIRLEISSFKVESLLEEVISLLEEEVKKNKIKVEFQFLPLPPLLVDGERLKQVFLNICKNAVEVMEKGGRLRVETQKEEKEAVISISDTGPGIREEDLKRLFDPFFTTKSRGTGLGLSISHRIVEAHKGRIKVESKVGKGTTFHIFLPLP